MRTRTLREGPNVAWTYTTVCCQRQREREREKEREESKRMRGERETERARARARERGVPPRQARPPHSMFRAAAWNAWRQASAKDPNRL